MKISSLMIDGSEYMIQDLELTNRVDDIDLDISTLKNNVSLGEGLTPEKILSVETNKGDYLLAHMDANREFIGGVKHDGTWNLPAGVETECLVLLDNGIPSLKFKGHDEEYSFAVADANNNLLFGTDKSGAVIANKLTGAINAELVNNEDYLMVTIDDNNNVLFGVRKDGTFYAPKTVSENAGKDNEDEKEEFLSVITNDEFLFAILDKNEEIVWGIRTTGYIYQPKGVSLEQNNINKDLQNKVSDLEYLLSNNRGGTGDWSDKAKLSIPEPRLAAVNFKTKVLPTAKSGLGVKGVNCQIPCEMEFWDFNGNYFKKWILLSAQGNSSMSFEKKNFAFDMFVTKQDMLDDGDAFKLRIGNWVEQDSYHMKAYYTDAFRGIGVVSYKIWESIVNTRPLRERRPYKYLYNQQNTTIGSSNTNLSECYDDNALCHPDAFPVIVFQNGEFYGVYSFQIKKHRDNYHMNKKDEKAIHLDGTISVENLWAGTINWTGFEVRNPKSLYLQESTIIQGEETTKYNGDFPRELMGTDSPLYKDSKSDMVKTAAVKESIIELSHYVERLSTASKSYNDEQMREMINDLFDVNTCIDYIIFSQVINNSDGFNKNWQWMTWDGHRWVVQPYDLDMSFGGHFQGNRLVSVPTGFLGNSLAHPIGWIFRYFMPEMKTRYAQLRKLGLFDPENMIMLLKNWIDRIGVNNFELEFKRWNESPCHRDHNVNENYWDLVITSPGTWNNTTNYRTNNIVVYNAQVWKCIGDNLLNVEPEEGVNWHNITWNAETTYATGDEVYYGRNTFFKFVCKQECTGEAPMTLYAKYPYEIGYYDSIYRVLTWMEQRMIHVDRLFEYQAD